MSPQMAAHGAIWCIRRGTHTLGNSMHFLHRWALAFSYARPHSGEYPTFRVKFDFSYQTHAPLQAYTFLK